MTIAEALARIVALIASGQPVAIAIRMVAAEAKRTEEGEE